MNKQSKMENLKAVHQKLIQASEQAATKEGRDFYIKRAKNILGKMQTASD